MTEYEFLTQWSPVSGVVSLPHCDSIEIAWANVQAGLSSFQEQDSWMTFVDGQTFPIMASPFTDLELDDAQGRFGLLLGDLLTKLRQENIPANINLLLSGDWSPTSIDMLRSNLGSDVDQQILACGTSDALQQWNNAVAADDKPWLWVAVHTGCAKDSLRVNAEQLACSERSEGIYSTDCAVAILFEHQQEHGVKVCGMQHAENLDPMQDSFTSLKGMLQQFTQLSQRTLVHTLPLGAETEIELYKARQSDAPQARTQWPDSIRRVNDTIALGNTLGDLGVCSLPILVLIQHAEKGLTNPIVLAHEGRERFVWSPLAPMKTDTQEGS